MSCVWMDMRGPEVITVGWLSSGWSEVTDNMLHVELNEVKLFQLH